MSTTQRLYMNVYRAGHYHRQGKPGHTNIHAGDFFTSEKDARDNAEPEAGYLATVPFDMPVPEGATILSNPEGSEPTPLSVTRRNPLTLMPWHSAPKVFPVAILNAGVCPWPSDARSLETADDPLGMTYEKWKAERDSGGFRTHPQAHQPRLAALLAPPAMVAVCGVCGRASCESLGHGGPARMVPVADELAGG